MAEGLFVSYEYIKIDKKKNTAVLYTAVGEVVCNRYEMAKVK
jgi:hypothetical protein